MSGLGQAHTTRNTDTAATKQETMIVKKSEVRRMSLLVSWVMTTTKPLVLASHARTSYVMRGCRAVRASMCVWQKTEQLNTRTVLLSLHMT